MDSTALRNLFRSQQADTVEPYLWCDEEIYGYIDDAQKMFCRIVGGIVDGTSTFTMFTLVPGTDVVPLDPRILKIKDAFRTIDGRAVDVISFEKARDEGFRFDAKTHRNINAIITGIDKNSVRVYPVPSAEATDTIQLFVERLPLVSITGRDQTLEIDEQHHRHLLLWVRHLAYDKQDADTYDRKQSVDYFGQFTAYCERARREKERAESVPRLMAYGGPGVGVSNNGGYYGYNGRSACRY